MRLSDDDFSRHIFDLIPSSSLEYMPLSSWLELALIVCVMDRHRLMNFAFVSLCEGETTLDPVAIEYLISLIRREHTLYDARKLKSFRSLREIDLGTFIMMCQADELLLWPVQRLQLTFRAACHMKSSTNWSDQARNLLSRSALASCWREMDARICVMRVEDRLRRHALFRKPRSPANDQLPPSESASVVGRMLMSSSRHNSIKGSSSQLVPGSRPESRNSLVAASSQDVSSNSPSHRTLEDPSSAPRSILKHHRRETEPALSHSPSPQPIAGIKYQLRRSHKTVGVPAVPQMVHALSSMPSAMRGSQSDSFHVLRPMSSASTVTDRRDSGGPLQSPGTPTLISPTSTFDSTRSIVQPVATGSHRSLRPLHSS